MITWMESHERSRDTLTLGSPVMLKETIILMQQQGPQWPDPNFFVEYLTPFIHRDLSVDY